MTPTPDTLRVREGIRLTATARTAAGAEIVGRTITWMSSDATVATVSDSGVVGGVAPGVATITAATGGVSGSGVVTVYSPSIASISLSPAPEALETSESVWLVTLVRDQMGRIVADPSALEWTSDHTAVATVDSTGRVVGFAPGLARITVTARGGGASASVTIVVVQGPAAAWIDGDWTMTLTISPGCRDAFPVPARVRTYLAHIAQQGTSIEVRVASPTTQELALERGKVTDTDVRFSVDADTDYGSWISGGLYDRFSSTEFLNIWGDVRGSFSGTEIRATLGGGVNYWGPGSSIASGPTVICNAADHVLTLRR